VRGLLRLCGLSSILVARVTLAHGTHDDDVTESAPLVEDDDATHDVPETTVRARAPSRSAATVHLTPRDILRFAPRSADDVLTLVPGLHVVQHGSLGKAPQIYMRGFDAAHGADVEVTLDGVPLNAWSHVHAQGYIDQGFIIPEALSDVVVEKGAFTLGQGRFAHAGSIDYRLGASQPGERVKLEVSSLGRIRLVGVTAPDDENLHAFVAGEVVTDRGAGPNRDATRASVNTAYETTVVGTRARAFAVASHARFGLPGALRLADVESGARAPFATLTPFTEGTSTRALTALSLSRSTAFGHVRALAHLGALHMRFDENFTGALHDPEGDGRRQEEARLSSHLLLTSRTLLLPWLKLRGLAQLSLDGARQDERALDLALRSRTRTRGLDFALGNGSLGSALEAALLPSLVVETALRAELFAIAARDPRDAGAPAFTGLAPALVPRARIAWTPFTFFSLYAAYGRGVRPPEARALRPRVVDDGEPTGGNAYTGGSPRATLSDQLEISTSLRAPAERAVLTLAGFATAVDEELVYDHVSGLDLARGATRRIGIDSTLTLAPTRTLLLDASLSLTDARFVDDGTAVPGVPPALFRLVGEIALAPGIALGGRARVLSARPLAHGAFADPVTLLDVFLRTRLRALSLALFIDNALDARDTSASYHFASAWDARTRDLLPTTHVVMGQPRTLRAELALRF
jgi:iron complex outermembrane receptor protein